MGNITYHVENHVATLTLQSPPANALSTSLLEALSAKLDDIEKDGTVKAILLKGEGKFFSAGADIKEFTSLQNESDYTNLSQKGQELFNRVENFHVPIIAAIHGAALGGGLELAMACHIRYAAKDAKFGLPELNLGIIPGFAGTQRLPAYVGAAKAYEMMLSSCSISGEEAEQEGLVNKSFEEDEMFQAAEKLAGTIAQKSGPTIRQVMELVSYTRNPQFKEGSLAEAKAFGVAFGTEDAKEGIQAFMEKRKPNFKD
ncbi:putative enoyl-CoA hydratase [Thalassobacillus devorans]|uniref:Enoyl-CoA hydratase n=1 Tax=Thalassobacillus devorans TaxID=279813 RepID=A0ABQ1PAZ4_9BACI|nr:enoyl-CoA hydratase [Thalassobacillus devorans]NIK29844.1 enoyl-CoA hydratase [Thalassobacillus devorans]GGC93274.1 putative enoyl-CoA hydratase [Thalassobacillus devorans]